MSYFITSALHVLPLCCGTKNLNMSPRGRGSMKWLSVSDQFSASSAGGVKVHSTTHWSHLKGATFVAISFSGTYLHLHQLQLPSRKWPSHESHVNLCIRTQKKNKDRDEIRKITNAKLHYFPPVIATILQCWPEGSASEISQGLSLGHLEISSDRRIQNDQSQGLRTNIIYIYIILGALLGTLSFKFPFFNWKPYLWAWNPPFLVRPKRYE